MDRLEALEENKLNLNVLTLNLKSKYYEVTRQRVETNMHTFFVFFVVLLLCFHLNVHKLVKKMPEKSERKRESEHSAIHGFAVDMAEENR